jgi:multidrug efflux pump subunit AcrB
VNFRNISAWAIRNPIPPIVLFIALTMAGIIAFMQMSVTDMPDVEFPAAIVTIVQPGAAPTELETQVAQKIESAVRNINGVDEINSGVREGVANIFVQFAIGTPIDRGVSDVRDAVSNIRSDLPDGILEPQVRRLDVNDDPIAIYSVEAFDMTLEEISWYVDNVVAKRLRSIAGMAKVERNGGVNREIRIILDPAKMQSLGVSASQVNAQIRQVNVNAAGGRAEIAGSEQAVRVLGNAANAFRLGETQIALGGGRTVKLSDIASVRDGFAEQRSLATMNGRQVLSFELSRAKGASDVSVYDDAQIELAKLKKENPKVQFRELFTSVKYTKGQYESSILAMVEGAVLAVLIVFIFLRDWRATFISAIAIPLSAIPAFWFMDRLGFTLNTISMLALSLVAGVLVDDAIVEIENIVRHMRMGKTAYQASIDAADEIGLAVLATTMAIVAVFLPVGLMPGVSGQFFKNFGLTVVVAVLLSMLVARLITPMVAAYFLKAHGIASHGEGKWMDRYMAMLRWSLSHRWWTVGAGALALVLTVASFAFLPFTFQPDIDFDYSRIRVEMVPGTTVAQTQAVAQKVQNMLKQESPIVSASYASINPGNATIRVTLSGDRTQSSGEFEKQWAKRLNDIPDARISFISQSQQGPGGANRDVTVTLGGDNPDALNASVNALAEQMKGVKELVAPRVSGDLQRPEIIIKPRFDLAASLGVTTAALSQTIRLATLGDIDQNSGKFSLADRQIPIRVSLSEQSRQSLSTIENLPVPTATGGSVPLKTVAAISFGAGPTTIQRTNQERRITVGADLAVNPDTGKAYVSSEANQKVDALPAMKNLPEGVKRLTLGSSKWQGELVRNFFIAVPAGIFLVFAVLVLLYRRVMPPFVNMGSLILAPLGAGLALLITGTPLSMPVMIGILMLFGIVAKNSILLVDFALDEMERGVDKTTAIINAGHKRAQPIVMTTVAMVAGMVPTALALTGDGAWRQPMGITVIGGLIVSTVLTLVIVPASFSLAVGLEERVGPWASYWLTTGGNDKIPSKPPSLFPEYLSARFRRRRNDLVQPAE